MTSRGRTRSRVGLLVLLVGLPAGATPAAAHPHDPNDPFAYFPSDTLTTASPALRPWRAEHGRWRLLGAGPDSSRVVGTLEQRVGAIRSPAGRRWLVTLARRDAAGAALESDSILVGGGAPSPIYERSLRGADTLELSYLGPRVSGWRTHRGGREAIEATLRLGGFPRPMLRSLLGRLPVTEGYATEIAAFDPFAGEAGVERRIAVRVAGEFPLRVGGRVFRCWKLLVADRESEGVLRTVWIEHRSRRFLREVFRDADGTFLGGVEPEAR